VKEIRILKFLLNALCREAKSSSAEGRLDDGGRADAVALLVSYFVEGNPQELVGIYWKPLSKTVESFTSPSIRGGYLDRNVYLITGKDTVSAAEGFCYDMKNLKLATLVGEVTAGAANPGSMKRVDDHFSLFLRPEERSTPLLQKLGGHWHKP
jgi:retinol-binding protein 3